MRSTAYIFLIIFAILTTVALVLLSPILLDYIATKVSVNSQRVSELGQSYGAISALLSAIALCILAASTVVQIKQTKIGQLHAARTVQLELARMALADPEFQKTLGGDASRLDQNEWRSHTYLNLWLMYVQMNFLTGVLDEQGTRRYLIGEFFCSTHSRSFWNRARSAFVAEATNRQQKRFITLVDEECERASHMAKPIVSEGIVQ